MILVIFRITELLLLLSLTCLITTTVNAQQCDTEATQEDIHYVSNLRKALDEGLYKSSGEIIDVPVKFHIISDNAGNGGVELLDIMNELKEANDLLFQANISLYHCGEINYINDSEYTDFLKYTDETLCNQHDVPYVLNVYFANSIYKFTNGERVTICGYAGRYGEKDRIFVANYCASNGSTFVHEVAHAFSLLHTHTKSIGSELVNGTNCLSAGDLLCDTPADPQLSSNNVTEDCLYNGVTIDANGMLYKPHTDNIMSYSRKSCRTKFSVQQLFLMEGHMLSLGNYANCSDQQISSTSEVSSANLFKVYPNPMYDVLFISSTAEWDSFDVYDLEGRIQYNYKFEFKAKEHQVHQLSQFPPGIYFIRIQIDQESYYTKFVKA